MQLHSTPQRGSLQSAETEPWRTGRLPALRAKFTLHGWSDQHYFRHDSVKQGTQAHALHRSYALLPHISLGFHYKRAIVDGPNQFGVTRVNPNTNSGRTGRNANAEVG